MKAMVDPCVLPSALPLSGAAIHSPKKLPRHFVQPVKRGFLLLVQDQNNKTDVIGLHDEEFKLDLLHNAQKAAFAELRAARRLSRKFPSINEPVLVDIQEPCNDFILFCFGIAGQCLQHEEIQQYLMSGCGKRLQENFDISVLSELMGIQCLVVHGHEGSYSSDDNFGLYGYGYHEPIYRQSMAKFRHGFQTYHSLQVSDCSISYSRCKESLRQFHQRDVGAVDWVQPEPRILMFPMMRNMADGLLPNVSELHQLNSHSKSNKKSGLLPDFRISLPETSAIECEEKTCMERHGTNKFETEKAPTSSFMQNVKSSVSSPEKLKLKHHKKKKSKGSVNKGRDIFKRNQFQHYEVMLSVLFTKDFAASSGLELTKSSREEFLMLLNQLAVTLAGSGLGIMLCVAAKTFSVNALFDSRKLMNIVSGLGLIWLSAGVKNLRDAFFSVTGINEKIRPKQRRNVSILKKELSHVCFKVFTLMAISVLRFV